MKCLQKVVTQCRQRETINKKVTTIITTMTLGQLSKEFKHVDVTSDIG